MDENTSIGPAENPPADAEKRKGQPPQNEIDAQSANEFDTRHGLAGVETKPFAKPPTEKGGKAFSSQPDNDPNEADPNRRADLIDERRNPGSHGGGGDPGRKKS